jgi:hypothetical protein
MFLILRSIAMNDWEIEYLEKVLLGKKSKVFYDLAGEWVVVNRIGDGPVAYIQKGWGLCIALYNCDVNDFYVAKRLI